jgi:hypothetical protein
MNDLTDNEFPSLRADAELVREKTGIRLEGPAGPLKAKVHVTTDGAASSPASAAVTMLLLVTTACIPPFLLGMGGWLIHAPALPLTAIAAGLFVILFATGTYIAFRPGKRPGLTAGFRHVVPRRPVIQDKGSGAARPGGHKAIQNGNGTKKARAASRRRRNETVTERSKQ